MRFTSFFSIFTLGLFLGACASSQASFTPTVGMSSVEYIESCGSHPNTMVAMGEVLIGECAIRPDEYVVFSEERALAVFNAEEFLDVAISSCGDSKKCADNTREQILGSFRIKSEYAEQQNAAARQRFFSAMGRVGDSMQSLDRAYAPAPSQFPSQSTTSCAYDPSTQSMRKCFAKNGRGQCLTFGTTC